ncbi:histidine phosphatase family protein, partial [Mesorhizobium sp. BHbdii]
RTRETMERIRAAMKVDPLAYRTDTRLIEVNFGDWQSFTFAELETQSPGAKRSRARDKWNFQPPGDGAESYQMLLERVKPCFDEIDRKTICVTHGGVMRTLFRFVLDVTEDEAANLEIPQDRVLKLEGQSLEWL